MAGMLGTITNLISSCSKLLPSIRQNTPSSSPIESDNSRVVSDELNKLMRTAERIKATLCDAEEREIRDHLVKLWLNELRKVAYAADDLLSEYQYEVVCAEIAARDGSKGKAQSETLLFCGGTTPGSGVVERIREIRSLFDEIARDRDALQLREEDGPRRNDFKRCDRQINSSLVIQTNIFGREVEKENIIDLLAPECKRKTDLEKNMGPVFSVLPIVGKGGLGKTIIAQLIYNDPRVRNFFDDFAWVCIYEDFSVERITQEMIECITGRSTGLKSLSALQEQLKSKITDKKVFVVLDDVWNENNSLWQLLRATFTSGGAAMVRILATTRNNTVSKIMQTMPPFQLGYLPDDECWLLFRLYAFRGIINNENSNLVRIGRQIMEKCGRMPLAVKAIASLLRNEMDEVTWRDVLESDLWELDGSDTIYAPLQISYARLPPQLKPCFLFCCMFPKDYVYEVEELIRAWLAQGYIESNGKKTTEEIGFDYVEELKHRSLFDNQNEGRNLRSPNRNTFKMHDLIHDLACLNSRKEYYSIMGGNLSNLHAGVRHIYVDGCLDPVESIPRTLRTLFLTKEASTDQELHKFLRNLKYLRHLQLKHCGFGKLPESVCSLYNLQTLALYQCHNLVEIPEGIGNLVSLRFLLLSNCKIGILPESIGYLRNLKMFRISTCPLFELPETIGNFVQLEEFVLHECAIQVLPQSICKLTGLQKLSLTCCYNLRELPQEIGNLTNLHILAIRDTKVQYLPRTNKLTAIRTVDIKLLVSVNSIHGAIGWLNESLDHRGTLCIEGLENMVSISDACSVNLINKKNIEELILSWNPFVSNHQEENALHLRINSTCNMSHGDHMDLSLLGSLQPNPNLRRLHIDSYPCITLPKWIEDYTFCASLETIYLEDCYKLRFVNFGSLKALKNLKIVHGDSLQLLQRGSLPIQLKELVIQDCRELTSLLGVQNLCFLTRLEIYDCPSLQFLFAKPLVPLDLTEHFYEVLHFNSSIGLRNLTSLEDLKVHDCHVLELVEDELLPIVACKIEVSGCPKLRRWCQKNDFKYYCVHGLEGEYEDASIPSSS